MKPRRHRYARYITISKAKDRDYGSYAELSFSSDSHQWTCICLTKHELRKLSKVINKYLQK